MPQTPLHCEERRCQLGGTQAVLIGRAVQITQRCGNSHLPGLHLRPSVRWFLAVPKLILTAMGGQLCHESPYLETRSKIGSATLFRSPYSRHSDFFAIKLGAHLDRDEDDLTASA